MKKAIGKLKMGDFMMKIIKQLKKGFTLIELLAVIVILAIVLIIAVPAMGRIIIDAKSDAYEKTVRMVENATQKYIIVNPSSAPADVGGTSTVQIADLISVGLLETLPKDPRDNTIIEGTTGILITKVDDNYYTFELQESTDGDTDGDGVSDIDELAAGTNPNATPVDTDSDNLYDDYEIVTSNTSPELEDTDMDGDTDGEEITNGTNPLEYIDSNEGTLEYDATGDYYIIGSLADLIQMNKDVNNLTGDTSTYELDDTYYIATDIDLIACTEVAGSYTACTNDTDSDPSNGNWTPIGVSGAAFTGSFLGKNNNISNVNIDLPTINYVGFFGEAAGILKDTTFTDAEITGQIFTGLIGKMAGLDAINVDIDNITINGSSYAGGLAGQIATSGTTIDYVNITGTVTGTSDYTGGITGQILYGTIRNTISAVDVTGTDYVGGLAGYTMGLSASHVILEAVNAGGSVTGTGTYVKRGIGKLSNYTYADENMVCLDTIEVNGSTVVTSVEHGKDSSQADLNDLYTYEGIGFDTYMAGDNLTDGYYWDYDTTGVQVRNSDYHPLTFDLSGAGTEGDPYLVSNNREYKQISQKLDKYYKLTSNLDFENEDFYVIGSFYNQFTGSIDGDDYSVSNAIVNSTPTNYTGVIGGLANGVLKNIKYIDAEITGSSYVGLIGYIEYMNVTNVEAENITVIGYGYLGGLAGQIRRATALINYVKVSGSVTGTAAMVGGIAGYITYGEVKNTISSVDVESETTNVGGLVGYTYGTSDPRVVLYAANIGGSVTGIGSTTYIKRCGIYRSTSYIYAKTLALDSILVNDATVPGFIQGDGTNMTLAEAQTLSTYTSIEFDITSDSDADGYYWTMLDNELIIVNEN